MSQGTAEVAEPVARTPRRRGRLIAIISALVAAVLVVALLVFLHWRDGLRLFDRAGNEIGIDEVPVGKTLYVSEVWSPTDNPLRIDLTSMAPVVTVNTARADVRVVMCTDRPGQGRFGDDWSLTRWCSAVRPFKAGTYRLSASTSVPGSVVGVVAITPYAPGHVHITGVRTQYERGLRRGDQRVGTEIDTRTK